ncbi:glycosyltransferase [Lentzea rhizosphaerae]|uniref:Glycosyltransferase n=1 Tax=Lentzea rhizosphaerae TaxID=2041025 RepID=A0ABV8C0S3_9PSEU
MRPRNEVAVDEHGTAPVSRLDGARRRSVVVDFWRRWRQDGHGSGLLFGISGVGKSDGVVRPLQDWANSQGIATVWVDVPANTTSVDSRLLDDIDEELGNGGHTTLRTAIAGVTGLAATLRVLLRAGALVVLDEFQRMLEPDGHPSPPIARLLEQLGRRPADAGYLLLVSNRHVDWSWAESFDVVELPPPHDDADAVGIVLQQLAPEDAATRFPESRRLEVAHRLGHNPRVLRLLGLLLKSRVLAELLPLAETDFTEPVDPQLINDIERKLLAKAAEGLPEETNWFLQDMSVLRDWSNWELTEAMGRAGADVRSLVRQSRDRYLLQVRSAADPSEVDLGGRYQVHPLLREVNATHKEPAAEHARREAHVRAGKWYARKLKAVGRTTVHDHTLALGLDGARYHFTAAGATAELLEAIKPIRHYIKNRYGSNAQPTRTAAERNARITLLEIFNNQWGTPGTHYHLAVCLRDRGAPGDLERATGFAKLATTNVDNEVPWVLWIRLVRATSDGPDAAIAAAREATENVAPNKNLYIIYQLLGSFLNEMGLTEKAVAVLREGINRAGTDRTRIAAHTVKLAAEASDQKLLDELCDWLSTMTQELEPQHLLAQALRLERRNHWADAIDVIGNGPRKYASYPELTLHKALCLLAVGEPAAAQEVLDRFPNSKHRHAPPFIWCAAFVALEHGMTASAATLLGSYLDEPAPPTTSAEIRARLLYEWDRVTHFGSQSPSLEFPVLPPRLTGLPGVVLRPQYGGPVLPQHQPTADASATNRPHVLALAAAWSPTSGGVPTFNRLLCLSLASTAQVTCVVLKVTDEERREAADAGVTLVEAQQIPGATDSDRLSYPVPLLEDLPPDLIIGHGRWTGLAARRLARDFPDAERLHFLHVIPDEIEQHKPKEGVDVAALAEERQEIELALGTDANHVVAVGPRIYGWFHWDFERRGKDVSKLLRYDPGFDSQNAVDRSPPRHRWIVLVTGRMEDDRLKGLDLAARAFNEARLRRRPGTPPVVLLVRGAPDNESTALENKMREWAGDPSLPVQVRPYTTKAEVLSADLRGASLVLMPSRAEGFGLVAAEAVAAGTPVLVSDASGFGDLLQEVEPEEAARIVVPVTGDDDRDVEKWSAVIESALRDRDAEFRRVADLRDRLATKFTWASASAQLLDQVRLTR